MIRLAALCLALLAAAAAPGTARAAQSEVVPAGSRIELAVNQGQLVKLTKPMNSVFIADPTIADVQVKSPTLIYIVGKASGTTTLYAVSEQDEVLINAEVHVRYDAERVERAIHELVPHSAIAVNTIADSIVLTGTVYSAAEGDDVRRIATRFVHDQKQLINKLKVDAPSQINLRVRIAEVSRTVVKQFGFNWQNVFDNGKFVFGLATGVPALLAPTQMSAPVPGANGTLFSTPTTGAVGAYSAAAGALQPGQGGVNSPSAAFGSGYNVLEKSQLGSATNNNLIGGLKTKNLNLNTLVDALDNHGLATILAEPNLTAISGEAANFLAGGEFPVPVPAGTGLVGIEWKKFGVSLNFVGTITNDDRISLHVAPEVSDLSTAGAIVIDSISVPSLTERHAETTVELASGQSFAIAGLLQNNVAQNINKFPWLGDLPVLGQLFRSEAFQRNETELVIIVTPYVVHPIATASRALAPTDGYVPSTDGQLVLQAKEYQQQPARPPAPPAPAGGASLIGPVGFELQ